MSCPLFCVRVGQMPMWLEKSEKKRVKRSGCFALIKIHLQSVGTALAAVRNPQKLVGRWLAAAEKINVFIITFGI